MPVWRVVEFFGRCVKEVDENIPIYKISCVNEESARSMIMDVINKYIVPYYIEKYSLYTEAFL